MRQLDGSRMRELRGGEVEMTDRVDRPLARSVIVSRELNCL